ncbi:50S ribosomal protein L15 [Candidatus Peregrinibacteria bacterium]|jgi:large subunit ribosomal protein L15|nr:50S ribosomal protein L15 [Candidatus Peregrinibacteria bacterium]MBT4147757.1 50S ribosomal protein L15 [Candidatus Peregrinibacteria bacterium]MBT4365932.1 50S ribosomal protein L15 [Candidatus Peregrinibacteria bacterium]MBT4456557.1 50S ribosomal protein L15 [Candidatus Peregrinibacteria bacterium]
MSLTELKSKNFKARKRVGRGNGSGHGTYSCRGQKGQSSRSGGRRKPGFEGGQTPLHMKMPKLKGFTNINRIDYKAINVGDLEEMFKEGEVDLTNPKNKVKLLGNGEVNKKFTIKVDSASASAIEKIKKAGGDVEVLAQKKEKKDKETRRAERIEAREKNKTDA